MGQSKEEIKKYMADYYQRNKDTLREKHRIYYQAYCKEHREDIREGHKAYNKAHPNYQREYHKKHLNKLLSYAQEYRKTHKDMWWEGNLKRKYGLTAIEYNNLLAAQGGGCKICGVTTPGDRVTHFFVDHNHNTGKVRGLLCLKCNSGLGNFQDNPDLLAAAQTYLVEA